MLFIVLLSRIGRKASWPMRDIETLPSRQIYLYLSLVERREWEFYHTLDRRGYLVWLGCISFFTFWRELMVSLRNERAITYRQLIDMNIEKRPVFIDSSLYPRPRPFSVPFLLFASVIFSVWQSSWLDCSQKLQAWPGVGVGGGQNACQE